MDPRPKLLLIGPTPPHLNGTVAGTDVEAVPADPAEVALRLGDGRYSAVLASADVVTGLLDRFRRDHLTGRENPGKKMALFGVGNIGYEIWKIAGALGIAGPALWVRHATDGRLYSSADVAAVPATPETLVLYLRWLARSTETRAAAKPAAMPSSGPCQAPRSASPSRTTSP